MSTTPTPVPKPSFQEVFLALLPAIGTAAASIQTVLDPNTNNAGKKAAVENLVATGLGAFATIKGMHGQFDPAAFQADLDMAVESIVKVINDFDKLLGKAAISL